MYTTERARLALLPLFRKASKLRHHKRTLLWLHRLGGKITVASLPLEPSEHEAVKTLGIVNLEQLLLTPASDLIARPSIDADSIKRIRKETNRALFGPDRVKHAKPPQGPFDPKKLDRMPFFSRQRFAFDVPIQLDGSYMPNTPLDALVLSGRARRALRTLAVRTIGELLLLNRDRLLSVRRIGKKTVDEIRQAVTHHLLLANGLAEMPKINYQSFRGMIESFVQQAVHPSERGEVMLQVTGWCSGQPRNMAEVGRKIGYSRERVRQTVARAIAALTHPSKLPMLARFWAAVKDAAAKVGRNNVNAIASSVSARFGWAHRPPSWIVKEVLNLNPHLVLPPSSVELDTEAAPARSARMKIVLHGMSIPRLRKEIALREQELSQLQSEKVRLERRLRQVKDRMACLAGTEDNPVM